MDFFKKLGQSRLYWSAMVLTALAYEGIALYYQYALNEYPCVLCIHIRIWVLAFVLVGLLGLVLRPRKSGLILTTLLSLIASVGLLERSWQTLATERLWIEGSCSLQSGLPSWFALDIWFPAVFEVQASCGYTPEILFGITMAEALIFSSVFALGVTSLISIALFRK